MRLFLIAVMGVWSTMCHAGVSADDILAMEGDQSTKLYVAGLVDGLLWANAGASSQGGKHFICPPDKVPVTHEQGFAIFKRFILSHKDKVFHASPAGLTMTFAFIDAFPCPK